MKEVIERIFTKQQATLNRIGIFQPVVDTRGSSPYLDIERFRINIRWMVPNRNSGFFTICIHALFGCCGVIELNRPSGNISSQQQFNAVMDVVMEGLRWKADPKMNLHELWGNQILATTSSDSHQYFRPYLVSRRWRKFQPTRNPRTGHAVTIWKKTV